MLTPQASGVGTSSHSSIAVPGVAAGELEGVLRDLGIEPVLLHAGGVSLQGGAEEGMGGGLEDGQRVGGVVLPAGAVEAVARVKVMLGIALA